MENKIAPENYCISPHHINTKKFFLSAFGKMGAEVLANTIVQLCQSKGYWISFSEKELQTVCAITGANIKFLDNLLNEGLVVADSQKRYCVTEEFIKKCHEASPAK